VYIQYTVTNETNFSLD